MSSFYQTSILSQAMLPALFHLFIIIICSVDTHVGRSQKRCCHIEPGKYANSVPDLESRDVQNWVLV